MAFRSFPSHNGANTGRKKQVAVSGSQFAKPARKVRDTGRNQQSAKCKLPMANCYVLPAVVP